MRKARLGLLVADLVIAGHALGAGAATTYEGDGHPVPYMEIPHFPTCYRYGPGQFVPRNVGQTDVRIVPHPPVPVTPAEPRGGHFYHHSMGFRAGVREIPNLYGTLEGLVNEGFHNFV